jgi:hypothetical protein
VPSYRDEIRVYRALTTLDPNLFIDLPAGGRIRNRR